MFSFLSFYHERRLIAFSKRPDERVYKLVTRDRYIVLKEGVFRDPRRSATSRRGSRGGGSERLSDAGSFRRVPGLITDRSLLQTGKKNSSVFQGRT